MDDQTVIIVGVVVAVIVLALVIIRFSMWVQWFSKELRYVNKEIARTTGKEQQRWKKRKKRLMLSIIPFFYY